jgi:hypothetical protein
MNDAVLASTERRGTGAATKAHLLDATKRVLANGASVAAVSVAHHPGS